MLPSNYASRLSHSMTGWLIIFCITKFHVPKGRSWRKQVCMATYISDELHDIVISYTESGFETDEINPPPPTLSFFILFFFYWIFNKFKKIPDMPPVWSLLCDLTSNWNWLNKVHLLHNKRIQEMTFIDSYMVITAILFRVTFDFFLISKYRSL